MKDFFISYNKTDEPWGEWIAWHLEKANYSTVLHKWDFRAGENFILKMNEALECCKHVILVISRNYLEAKYTQAEWTAVFEVDPNGKKRSVIPVKVRECEIRGVLRPIKMIDLVGIKNEQEAIKELISGVSEKDQRPKTPPKFPETTSISKTNIEPMFPGALNDTDQYMKMIKSAYLFLRIDQFSNKIKTSEESNYYLWGWSVCDPRRKKKVAKSQSEELRVASIVVSSFIISAYSSVLDMPGIGISSDDISTGLVEALRRRYYELPDNKGVFGTPSKTRHQDQDTEQLPIVNPNCRHITAALSILFRIIQKQDRVRTSMLMSSYSDDFSRIFPALRYLKSLKEYALFSQDPELLKGFPDCATCAIVLEFLDLLESIKDQLPYNSNNPFASSDELMEWTSQKIRLGLGLLKQLKIQVGDRDYWFWNYSIDKKRFKDYLHGKGIPPLTSVCKNIELYHTCRILYLLRNLISKPEYKNDLIPVIKNLEQIMVENGGALPSRYPTADSHSSHITNTAFLLNSLISDDLGAMSSRFDDVLIKGIKRISELFSKDAEEHLKEGELDLYADGMGMILRLFSYLSRFSPPNSEFVKELKTLNESARRIQRYIHKDQVGPIKEELAKVQLLGCFPVIKARIIDSRNLWLKEYSSP